MTGDAEAHEWAITGPLIEELRSADAVVIGAPMYSFGVSAALKAWIDRVTFPGAFADGALDRTPIVVVTASGGTYRPGTPRDGWDCQTPHLRHWFQSIGAGDLEIVNVELCLSPLVARLSGQRDRHETSLAEAHERILELVAR